jgi:F0F1-type ATP synthase assembly protein I
MAGSDRGGAWAGMGIGWAIVGTLVSGILAIGGIGYLVDRLAGTEYVFTGIGFVIGAAGAIYIVYLRFGREQDADG